MKKAAVVIGVDRTGHMPVLQAATSGAGKFAQWATAQGFDVELLTDAGRAVGLGDIKKAVKKFVDPGTYDKLVVFFSGHGMLTAPDNEVWLLSGAPDDTAEAVDVSGSIWLARAAGIPHVLFISDACRSVPANLLFGQVKGADIFPNAVRQKPRPEVDVFYAALPGHPAYENKSPDDAANNYRAIFTECLLNGLRGQDVRVVEKVATPAGERAVIPSYKLKPFLEHEVPAAAERVSIKLIQEPEIRVESHPPTYFGELILSEAGAQPPTSIVRMPPVSVSSWADAWSTKLESARGSRKDRRRASKKKTKSKRKAHTVAQPRLRDLLNARMRSHFRSEDVKLTPALRAIEKDSGFASEMAAILAARGRDHFETTTGFTVIGSTPTRAMVVGGQCDPPFPGPEGSHIRVTDTGDRASSFLMGFAGGTGTVLAIIPEFVGTVYVESGTVVNVNYTPARNTDRFHEYKDVADKIDERRAFVAVAARRGLFRLDPANAAEDAQYLRLLKGFDPTLGIYAAYAYAQTGAIEEIESVLTHMSYESTVIPFDIALLAQRTQPTVGSWLEGRLAPFCPMLTQGWSILATLGDPMPPILRGMRARLLPSLWTTFNPEGFQRLWARIEKGARP